MPLRYRHRILDHLSHTTYRPAHARDVARALRVPEEDLEVFESALAQLVDEERVEVGKDERVRLPSLPDEVTGTLRVNARGFGFVIPEAPFREGDLFVPRHEMADALGGDRVRARVIRQPWRARGRDDRAGVIGRIVEVIERGRTVFTGVLQHHGRLWLVEPDGRQLRQPVVVRDPNAKNAKAGDKVVIEILRYPEGDAPGEGVITRVLGEAGLPDVETRAVIEAHGLRTEFSSQVIEEAMEAARGFDAEVERETQERVDLRDELIFTIDPLDSRDYDDAIHIKFDAREEKWTLGVHIADVCHFVRMGGALDREAQARGNSVYLPRHVLPMLPEVLSNGVCSLQEGVPRLTKSAIMEFDRAGRVLGCRLCNSVIRSSKRLTYQEAQALIDGDAVEARRWARTETPYTDELVAALKLSDRFARILRKRRIRDGMIVLQLPEVELVFDDKGHVTGAQHEDASFTHTIIEMFMVEANEALARAFSSLHLPILRRIHPEPSFGDLAELRLFARAAHQYLPEEPDRFDLQRLLEATRESPAVRAIHFAVLRTLTKAAYSPALIGHFALASEHYAHFTSPIRRYPDLTLHRALQAFLEETDNGEHVPGGRGRVRLTRTLAVDARVPGEDVLIGLGRHCSGMEIVAEEAERSLRSYLVLQFLAEKHLGDEFAGVVTGVTGAGLFISIEQYLVDGFAALSDLPSASGKPDRWTVNEESGRLIAPRSGASIGIGDVVTVIISEIDLGSRQLRLVISKLPVREAKEVEAEPPRGKRSGRAAAVTRDADEAPAGNKRQREHSGRGGRGAKKSRAHGRTESRGGKTRRQGRRSR